MNQKDLFYNKIVSELEAGTLVLPTLPEVALEVRNVVDDPDATTNKLAEVIVTDPALSARLLKVANSPLYRGRVEIESVQMAVSRLGLKMVKNLVTSLVMEQMFQTKSKTLAEHLRELWEYSTKVSAQCQVLASQLPKINNDEAMLAGLIHAIGTLPILLQAEKEGIIDNKPQLDMIIENLYPQLGGTILKKWDFPTELISVAEQHRDLKRGSAGDAPDLVDIVQVAYLQTQLGTENGLDPLTLNEVVAFKKLGADTGFSVEEFDENSEEYLEALALFNVA